MGHRAVGGRYVDVFGEDAAVVAAKMTVEEAARVLGIKEESVRKRVRRGKVRSEKGADGRLYVYVDGTGAVRDENGGASRGSYADRSLVGQGIVARHVVEAKDETIRILRRQLEEEREARRRADAIIAQLTQLNAALTARVPGVEGPSNGLEIKEVVATAEGGSMAPENGSSWWRRRSGGK